MNFVESSPQVGANVISQSTGPRKMLKIGALLLCGALLTLQVSEKAGAQGAPLQITPKSQAQPVPRGTSRAPTQEMDPASVVKRANAALNGLTSVIADFSQTNSLGQNVNGRLFLLRPGRLRFEYAAPSPLEIIADGTSLAIRNKRLNTQDVYFIRQTPLKFLLKPNINLSQDASVLGVSSDPDHTIVHIEDKSTFGGTSKIDLYFTHTEFLISQWVVIDPQGGETKVRLSNIDQTKRPERSLFVINYERLDNQ